MKFFNEKLARNFSFFFGNKLTIQEKVLCYKCLKEFAAYRKMAKISII